MSNFTEANGTTAVSPYGTRRSLHFMRSQFVIDTAGVRQQNNSVTGFLDASVVYGTSAGAWADAAVCQRSLISLLLLCAQHSTAGSVKIWHGWHLQVAQQVGYFVLQRCRLVLLAIATSIRCCPTSSTQTTVVHFSMPKDCYYMNSKLPSATLVQEWHAGCAPGAAACCVMRAIGGCWLSLAALVYTGTAA